MLGYFPYKQTIENEKKCIQAITGSNISVSSTVTALFGQVDRIREHYNTVLTMMAEKDVQGEART